MSYDEYEKHVITFEKWLESKNLQEIDAKQLNLLKDCWNAAIETASHYFSYLEGMDYDLAQNYKVL